MKIGGPPTPWLERVGRKVLDSDFGSEVENGQRQTLLLSSGLGALAGAAVGTYYGFEHQGLNTVQETWVTRSIVHPKLEGWSHHVSTDYDRVCHDEGSGDNRHEVCEDELAGWRHRYTANISQRQVGSYQEPQFHNNNKLEPLLGAFLGAAGGALLGLGVGMGIQALRRTLAPVSTSQQAHLPVDRETARVAGFLTVGGGALGAIGGAVLGYASGTFEQTQKEVHSRSWDAPILENTRLGEIPRDYYQRYWILPFPNGANDYKNGTEEVFRPVPAYQADGQVAMQKVEKSFDTARYGPTGGAILGGLIGTGVGLAGGVAVSILLRMMNPPPSK